MNDETPPLVDERTGGRGAPRLPGSDAIRDADVSRVYAELSRITRRAAVRARGPESTLTVVDHSLVDFVSQHPGCMAIDIARYLRLNRSTISRQLAALIDAGLIESSSAANGRAKPLRVTRAGLEAYERSVRLHRTGLEARLQGWSDDDVALLAGLLERLGESTEPGLSEPPYSPTEPPYSAPEDAGPEDAGAPLD